MALLTTTIGAFPKPDYLPLDDWFRGEIHRARVHHHDAESLEPLIRRATREIVEAQVEAGIDVVTDGEVRRENYIHYHCRHLDGFDFETLVEAEIRGGASRIRMPVVSAEVRAGEPFLPRDWLAAQAMTDRPVKITLPGPLTIADSVFDRHYGNPARLGADLARALNAEGRALADAGCRFIQIDEPVFARRPMDALAFGFDNLVHCFDGIAPTVTRSVHICCGYPERLDQSGYPKAPASAYLELAEALDQASIDWVSIEDAHRPNDLAKLLSRFRNASIVLGVVDIARSRIEPVEGIEERLIEALHHIEAERLIAAPDCGLGHLGWELAVTKLRNLSAAAKRVA